MKPLLRSRLRCGVLGCASLLACVSCSSAGGSGSPGGQFGSAGLGGFSGAGGGTPGTGGTSANGSGGAAGQAGGAQGGSGGTSTGAVTLPAPSTAVVSDALAAPLSSYHRNASTGDIWCTPCDGAPVLLAAAAYAGDTSVDARLLQQMRELLKSGNDPFGTGGYSANDEKNATVMYAIAKLVPRIWNQLSAAEVHKIDLIMEATLVSDVYLTADKTNANGTPTAFDGDTNLNRDWNPNYREGMIGAVLVGTEYFGGQQATEALLQSYDHAAFTAELGANGLKNLYWTFDTYQRNPSAGAPHPQTVEQAIQGYAMHGMNLGQLLDLYVYLADDTFSAHVACGLNNGAGILVNGVYAGRITAGCSGLPNLGALGMEKEFDSVDAEGQRSSAGYARLGLRADLFNQLALVVYGGWKDTTQSTQALAQVNVGVKDFFYKAQKGYEGYSHAQDEGLFKCGSNMDCLVNQAIWTEILSPLHHL